VLVAKTLIYCAQSDAKRDSASADLSVRAPSSLSIKSFVLISIELMTTRTGVLLVHGVGEQHKFEHLESTVRNLATVLKGDPNYKSVHIAINTQNSSAYSAEHQTWQADTCAPIVLTLKDQQDQITEIDFHELWWADLDEPDTLKKQLEFWVWGLSLWTKPQYQALQFGKASQEMRLACPRAINALDRFRLFGFSFVVLLLLPLLSLLSNVLQRLGTHLRPDVIVQYLGDIKLYQQNPHPGSGSLDDLGQPPRVSIRRRMIQAMVNMSLASYDRWYILAHSLGSIVACNGLMETESALPNYLDKALWQQWQTQAHLVHSDQPIAKPIDPSKKMMPERPPWLHDDDTVARSVLFRNLRGVLTYGSPLSKFAVLWPAMVPINRDETVFAADCEWINVYDPTDPIADATKFYEPQSLEGLAPKEIVYRTQSFHLLSHNHYLSPDKNNPHRLVNQVAQWLATGKPFVPPAQVIEESQIRWYQILRVSVWGVAALLIAVGLSYLAPKVIPAWPPLTPWLGWFAQPITYFVLSALGVMLMGGVGRWLQINTTRLSP
jgi:hypothetical protein